MAAGWSQPSEREPSPPDPRPSFAERLRTIKERVSGSLAVGRKLLSVGLRVAEDAWNRVTGRRPVAQPEPKPAVKARVVELSDYRPTDRPAKPGKQSAVSDLVVEEKSVEEMQGVDAVNPMQPLGRTGTRPEPVMPPPSIESVEAELEMREATLTVEEAPAEDSRLDGPVASMVTVEAKESEPSGDDGEEPEDGDSEDEGSGDAEASGEDGDEQDSVEGDRLDSILESLLLAAGAPITVRRICDALRSGPKAQEVRAALKRLEERYSGDCGIHLVEVAGGYQFRTAPANGDYVRQLLREKPARLGRATLETLSIVAYKQPVTRADVEAIRGVDADSAINSLLAKKLIKIDGRKETVGRPLLYSTTPEFLEIFGLKDLKGLPTLKEIGPVPEPEDEDDIEETGIEEGEAAGAILEAAGEGREAGHRGPGRDEEAALDVAGARSQGDDGGFEARSQDDDGGLEARSQGDDGGLEARSQDDDGGLEARSQDDDGGLEARSQDDDGGLEARSEDDDSGFEDRAGDEAGLEATFAGPEERAELQADEANAADQKDDDADHAAAEEDEEEEDLR